MNSDSSRKGSIIGGGVDGRNQCSTTGGWISPESAANEPDLVSQDHVLKKCQKEYPSATA
ncbi:hypothetical protein KSP40_PGU000953 [Platanthera guangdongensis]|uniref:Uncharacterized protein n=1 Tax=Platanthera guangdongensis TaxID=2320717 RepID=A0ABR2LVF4_9ASPA